ALTDGGERALQRIDIGSTALDAEQERLERAEERIRITHRHRAERVAVITAFQCDERAPIELAALHVRLESDLERDLHGRRTVGGEDNAREVARTDVGERARD